jgi:hypothetical protein
MPHGIEGYRLVLFAAPEDPSVVRDLMASVTGIHPTDAMQWVARAPGVWPQPLSKDEAKRLLDGLYDLGVPAEARRADLFPKLSPPRTLHVGACLEDGFRVGGLRGEPTHWVPWDKVEVIAAGRVEVPDEFRDVRPPGWISSATTGLRAMLGRPQMSARRRRATRISHEPRGEVILVRHDPMIAFRVIENQMNYAYLGDRIQPSAVENFPIFLKDLCDRATHAYVTPSTEALLAGGPIEDWAFESSQSLLDYTTLRLLWSWYRKDRDSGSRNPL